MKRIWVAIAALALLASVALAVSAMLPGSGAASVATGSVATTAAKNDSTFRRFLDQLPWNNTKRTEVAAAPPEPSATAYPEFVPSDQIEWIDKLPAEIRSFVEQKYPERTMRAAMLWLAASHLQQLTLGSQSGELAVQTALNFGDAYQCVAELNGVLGKGADPAVTMPLLKETNRQSKELRAMQMQSKEAFQRYTRYQANLAGKALRYRERSSCAH